jgi:hypothetical protein
MIPPYFRRHTIEILKDHRPDYYTNFKERQAANVVTVPPLIQQQQSHRLTNPSISFFPVEHCERSPFPSPQKRGEGARRADERLLIKSSFPMFPPKGQNSSEGTTTIDSCGSYFVHVPIY